MIINLLCGRKLGYKFTEWIHVESIVKIFNVIIVKQLAVYKQVDIF